MGFGQKICLVVFRLVSFGTCLVFVGSIFPYFIFLPSLLSPFYCNTINIHFSRNSICLTQLFYFLTLCCFVLSVNIRWSNKKSYKKESYFNLQGLVFIMNPPSKSWFNYNLSGGNILDGPQLARGRT